jgi:hypothetical protein
MADTQSYERDKIEFVYNPTSATQAWDVEHFSSSYDALKNISDTTLDDPNGAKKLLEQIVDPEDEFTKNAITADAQTLARAKQYVVGTGTQGMVEFGEKHAKNLGDLVDDGKLIQMAFSFPLFRGSSDDYNSVIDRIDFMTGDLAKAKESAEAYVLEKISGHNDFEQGILKIFGQELLKTHTEYAQTQAAHGVQEYGASKFVAEDITLTGKASRAQTKELGDLEKAAGKEITALGEDPDKADVQAVIEKYKPQMKTVNEAYQDANQHLPQKVMTLAGTARQALEEDNSDENSEE